MVIGKSLAHDLQEELRGICVELLDPNYPPKQADNSKNRRCKAALTAA